MSLSDYSEGLILDYLLTLMPFYVALSTADPGEDGSTIAEPVEMGYARKESSAFSRPDNVVSNTAIVDFPVSTDAWGTITHFALFDAAVGGNMLGSAELTSPQSVITGKSVQFGIGALTITGD